MPWYLYLAFKQLFPTGRRFPFFTVIAVISVSLGVALLIVVQGVMGGFGHEIRKMIVNTQGDVQVKSDRLMENPAELQKLIGQVPGVVASTAFAEGVVMLEFERKVAYPAVQGIDLGRVTDVIPLDTYLRQGTLEALDDDSIILSVTLASTLGAHVGDKVSVYSPLLLEKIDTDEVLLPRELRVAGIFEIGHQQLDSSLVIVTLRLTQELYNLGKSVHGISVRVGAGVDALSTAVKIEEALKPSGFKGRARSWAEINQDFMVILQLEKGILTVILLFVVLVAAFLTMSLLLVLVLKKTREIGLLGALGANPRDIALCFCLQGIGIGVVGTMGGFALGFTFLHFRNDVLWVLTRFEGSQEMLSRFYQLTQVPAHSEPRDLVIVVVAAITLSTLAGLVPALIAARLKPVEALRSE